MTHGSTKKNRKELSKLLEKATTDLAAKLGDFYDRLRNLSEVDFEIKKEALVKEFMELTKPKLRPLALRQKIEIFLLSPEIISILEAGPRKFRAAIDRLFLPAFFNSESF